MKIWFTNSNLLMTGTFDDCKPFSLVRKNLLIYIGKKLNQMFETRNRNHQAKQKKTQN